MVSRLIPWNVLNRTRQMQTIITSKKSATLPTHFYGYGLGEFERDYNGRPGI